MEIAVPGGGNGSYAAAAGLTDAGILAPGPAICRLFRAPLLSKVFAGAACRGRHQRRRPGSMIQFLHAADLHLDSPLRGLAMQDAAHDAAPVEAIRRAARRAFDALVADAIERRVAFVVLAGDIFDGNRPDMKTALYFRKRLSDLDAAGIPVLLLHGNHDAANAVSHGVDLPPAVSRFAADAPETVVVPTDDGPVALHGQSFAEQHVKNNLARDYPPPLPGHLNIGVLHTALTGRDGHALYAPCTEADLVGKGYDYWALGHVHAHEVVRQAPWIVFPGNLQGRHVRETGAKGACLVSVDGGRITAVDFRPYDVFRWAAVTLPVDAADSVDAVVDEVRKAFTAALAGADGRPLAIRLTLTGATVLHPQLAGRIDDLRARVLAAGYDLGRDRLWLESLRVDTRLPDAGMTAGGLADGGLAGSDLIDVLHDLRRDPEALTAVLDEALGPLRGKLQDTTGTGDLVAMLKDPATTADLVEAATARILAELAPAGVDPA